MPSITYLGAKSEFQGDVHVDGNLRVDGIIHGNVEVIGDMEVSQSGLVEGAELRVHNLVVHGVVKSKVVAEGRVSLSRTARLEGSVTASSLDIEPGAYYTGHISTSDSQKTLPVQEPYPELPGQETTYQDTFNPKY
ncbi:MAG: polymer-forming cytoskeletal protein [Cyanobacteria bacterium P01_A01_bin.135]